MTDFTNFDIKIDERQNIIIDLPGEEEVWDWIERRDVLKINPVLQHFQGIVLSAYGERFTPPFPPKLREVTPMTSEAKLPRVLKHHNLLKGLSHKSIATILHGQERGNPYLDIVTDYPPRLNRPLSELFMQPAMTPLIPDCIKEPRQHYIDRALKHAQSEFYSYQYDDKEVGFVWKFDVIIIPVYGSEEIVAAVYDSDHLQRELAERLYNCSQ